MANIQEDKIILISDASALDKESKALANDIRSTDGRIHVYLLSEVAHMEEHRNPTRLNRFFTMVKGSGARVNAMHAFIQTFAHVQLAKAPESKEIDGDKITLFYAMRPVRKAYKWYDSKSKEWKSAKDFQKLLEFAQARKWWEFRPEAPVTAFVMNDRMATFFKAVFKAQYVEPNKENKIDKELFEDLLAVAKKHNFDLSKAVPEGLDTKALPSNVAKLIVAANANDESESETETPVETSTPAATVRAPRAPRAAGTRTARAASH